MTTGRDTIDAAGIASAASYVNNLLLARGLLRDGKAIHFERLLARSHDSKRRRDDDRAREDRHEKEEGADIATITTQVLNLIHDLVLGQDVRIQYQHNSLLYTTQILTPSPPHSAHNQPQPLSRPPSAHSAPTSNPPRPQSHD